MLKVKSVESATAPKFFVGGKPKTFQLQERTGAPTLSAALSASGKGYTLTTTSGEYSAIAIREIGQHFAELADVMDGKLKAA